VEDCEEHGIGHVHVQVPKVVNWLPVDEGLLANVYNSAVESLTYIFPAKKGKHTEGPA
jgi:hypothetical protein